MMSDDSRSHLVGLGAFIRSQRRLAQLSQRELAKLTKLSDPYVSQLERGLHEPSVRVLRSLGHALNLPPQTLMSYLGLRDDSNFAELDTAAAIKQDPKLSDAQKAAMLEIYKGFTDDAGATS
jgi:transcriptional regulator with XRE-family HTH domain